MITEDYVSFETAKLLKEKGFDAMCQIVYTHDGESKSAINFIYGSQLIDNADIEEEARYNGWIPYIQGEYAFLCPTLQMAMKWLITEKNFSINIELTIRGYFYSISRVIRDSMGYIIGIEDSELGKTPYYETYEEAADAAIKYCLENLI